RCSSPYSNSIADLPSESAWSALTELPARAEVRSVRPARSGSLEAEWRLLVRADCPSPARAEGRLVQPARSGSLEAEWRLLVRADCPSLVPAEDRAPTRAAY